jgi:DNA-binding transcriptional LysR family regulator
MGRLSVAAELGSTEAVKHAVAAGLGVSLVLEAAVGEEVAAGSLRTIRVQGLSLRKPLFVALAERTPGTAPVAAFRDMLLQQHQSSGGVTGL